MPSVARCPEPQPCQRPPGLRRCEQAARSHHREPLALDGEERKVAEKSRLHHPQHQARAEENEESRAPQPPPRAGTAGRAAVGRPSRGGEAGEHGPGDERPEPDDGGAEPYGDPPARGPRQRGEHERRGDTAEGESHLLDAHRDPPLPGSEEHQDHPGQRRVHQAPADPGHDEEAEKGRERWSQRGTHEGPARDQQTAHEGRPDANPVGQIPAGEREDKPADVGGGEEEADLEAAQRERLEQARRER